MHTHNSAALAKCGVTSLVALVPASATRWPDKLSELCVKSLSERRVRSSFGWHQASAVRLPE